MRIPIDYKTALQRHPVQVEEIAKKIRKGRSKYKNDGMDSFQWSYNIAVSVRGYTFDQIISGKSRQDQKQEDAQTVDEWVKDRVDATHTSLMATKGQSWNVSTIPNYCPPEQEHDYRKQREATLKEQLRISLLSQEEKDAETQAILKKLHKDPGFSGFVVPDDIKKLPKDPGFIKGFME